MGWNEQKESKKHIVETTTFGKIEKMKSCLPSGQRLQKGTQNSPYLRFGWLGCNDNCPYHCFRITEKCNQLMKIINWLICCESEFCHKGLFYDMDDPDWASAI